MANDIKQDIELGLSRTKSKFDTTMERAVLELRTGKGFRGGLRSNAQVFWIGDGFRSCVLYGDYSVTVKTAHGTATQKAIDRQHAAVFTPEVVAGLVADAKAYYAGAAGSAGVTANA